MAPTFQWISERPVYGMDGLDVCFGVLRSSGQVTMPVHERRSGDGGAHGENRIRG